MRFPLHPKKIISSVFLTLAFTTADASDKFETWVTEITCDQQHFTLTSYCKPSKKEFTMNSCRSDQVLAKAGHQPVALPQAQTRAINKELRATHWECRRLNNVSYLEIDYAAGLGNIPNNEAVEHYTLNLVPITDESFELKIMREGKNTGKGYVRSIMPDGDPSTEQPAKISQTPSAVAEKPDWRAIVAAFRDNPSVLTNEWPAYRRMLPLGCFQNDNVDELSCPPIEGLKSISVMPGPLGIVDLVLTPPASCEAIHRLLVQRFGTGTQRNSDVCSHSWNIRHVVRGAYIDLRRSRTDPSLMRLQFGIEQGP